MSRRFILIFSTAVVAAFWLLSAGRFPGGKRSIEANVGQPLTSMNDTASEVRGLPDKTGETPAPEEEQIASRLRSVSGTNAIDAFDDWFTNYQAARGYTKEALRKEGIVRAQTRLAALSELIRTNPEAALAAAVTSEQRAQLPPEFQQFLEKPVNTRADYTVTISDDIDNQRHQVIRRALINGQSFQVFTYGQMADRGTTPDFPVNGIAVSNELALAESPVRELSPSEAAKAQAELGTVEPVCAVSGLQSVATSDSHWVEIGGERIFLCGSEHLNLLNKAWTTDANGKWVKAGKGTTPGQPSVLDSWSQGPKTVLFIRVNFTDDLTEPISESAAYDLMNNVSTWIVANSYGSSSMITTVTPLLTLPGSKAYYSEVGDSQLLSDARTVARQAGYDTSDYQFDAVRFTKVSGFNYSGQAYVRGKGVWLQSSSVGVACHEFGHNYGLWHANYWNASQASIIGPGSHSEYGDIFDTMGSAGAGDRYFNANHRNKIDWLGDNYVQSVTQSGTYRIYAFDVDSLTPGRFYGLKIRKDYDRDYWLELRHLFASNPYVQNGVFLRWDPWSRSDGGSHLLDTTPGSPAASSSKDDAPLVVGRTFVDDGAGIFITPVAMNGAGADKSVDVVVRTGFFPNNQLPQISLQASATQVNPSDTVNFTAVATDTDGDELAYEWDFGDLNFGPNQPAIAYSWPAAGEYVVRCRVSDMKGGFASEQLIVRVGNPSTYQITGRVLDASGNPVEGVRVSNGSTSTSGYRGGFTDSNGNYTITQMTAGSSSITASLYGYTIAPASGWSNPLAIGSSQGGIDFVAQPMPTVGWTVIQGETEEAGGIPATVRITRTGSTASPLTVKYNRSGTATFTSDYTLSPAPETSAPYSLTIPAGAGYADVTITPVQDSLVEGPETVILTLTEDTAYKIGWQAEVPVEIIDDETPGKPSIYVSSSADNQATETGSDTMSFSVNRIGNKSGNLTVNYTLAGTATPNVDYTSPSGSVVIPDGETSATVTFAAIDDNLVEGDETVVVTVTPDSAYNISGGTTTLTITDDDPPLVKVAVTDNLAVEGGSATGKVVVQRIGNLAEPLTVNYTTGGTATSGSDYQTLPGSITIPEGAASATITVTALNDTEIEGDESVAIILTSSPDYNIGLPGSGVVVIQDNEIPTVTITATDTIAAEDGTAMGAFTVSRGSFNTGDLTVLLDVSGNAIPNVDYLSLPKTIVIPDGSTSATLTVTPVDDAIKESDESVTLTLRPSTAYNTGTTDPTTVTITDNDGSSEVAVGFESPMLSVSESQTVLKLPVVLSAPNASPMTVNYAVVGGTAQSGSDFNLPSGTLTFAANQTLATISSTILNDTVAEPDETIVLELSSPTVAVLNANAIETVTIVDDDAAVFSISATSDTATEAGAPGNFRITRSGSNANAATVQLQITGTASSPSDYQPLPTNVLFPAGATFVDVPVTPVDDNTPEVSETVVARITEVSIGRVGTPGVATVNILDNDNSAALPAITITAVDDTTTEGVDDPATIRVSRSGNLKGDLTIYYTTTGTAEPGLDLHALSGEIIIPDGETNVLMNLQATADAVAEPKEDLTFVITSDPAYQLGAQTQATIDLLDSPYMRWQLASFPQRQPNDSAINPAADPDGDGLNNFTEYAFNRDPNLPDAAPLFTQTLEPIEGSGDQVLVVTYHRRIERPDVNYILGAGGNLVQWDESAAELEEISVTPDANGITETVRTELLAPLSHFDRQFVRLRVVRP